MVCFDEFLCCVDFCVCLGEGLFEYLLCMMCVDDVFVFLSDGCIDLCVCCGEGVEGMLGIVVGVG